MTDTSEVKLSPKQWLQMHFSAFMPKNARNCQYQVWDKPTVHNSFGGVTGWSRVEGTVAYQDEDFVLVKLTGAQFRVICQHMLAEPVQTGAKVALIPFEFRDFSGLLSNGADDPRDEENIRSFVLTGANTYLPANWEGRHACRSERLKATWTTIQNPYLRDLIQQMESFSASFNRNVVDVLVCAGGKNVTFVDPSEENSYCEDRTRWPSIELDVSTKTFQGKLSIRYDRAMDTYSIDTLSSEGVLQQRDDIYFDTLSQTLQDIVDDGEWQKVKVLVIKPAPKAKKA